MKTRVIQTTPTRIPTDSVRLSSVSKLYGSGANAVTALRDLSLGLARGSFTAVMGPSGSGKSTFLHWPPASTAPPRGSVHLGDVELGSLGEDALSRLRRERIGFVFQSFNLVPSLTAAQNITLPLAAREAAAPTPTGSTEVTERVGLGRADQAQAGRALGRPAAARRDRPRAHRAARGGLRRRADRAHSTPRTGQGHPHAAARGRRRPRPDRRDGHPRSRPPPRTPTRSSSWPTAGSSTRSTSPYCRARRRAHDAPGGLSTMLRIALSTLAARKSGMLGAFAAVALAVVLVVSCGILARLEPAGADSRSSGSSAAAVRRPGQADARVRAATSTSALSERRRLPAASPPELRGVPGVATRRRRPLVRRAACIDGRGRVLAGRSGVSTVGHGWASAALTPFALASGHAPRAAGEIVVVGRARRQRRASLGRATSAFVTATARETFTVVGIASIRRRLRRASRRSSSATTSPRSSPAPATAPT